jgi:hypothetical protein
MHCNESSSLEPLGEVLCRVFGLATLLFFTCYICDLMANLKEPIEEMITRIMGIYSHL